MYYIKIYLILILMSFSIEMSGSPVKNKDIEKLQATELVVNGNFSQGSTGFYSDYIDRTGGTFAVGAFAITNNPKSYNVGFADCSDHTQDAAGLMMIFDSYKVSNKIAWSQLITVKSNTDYFFSMWATRLNGPVEPDLQIRINGVIVQPNFLIGEPTCTWSYHEIFWNSGSATSITIDIVNLNTSFSGNDFAIDDISLIESKTIILCDSTFSVKLGDDFLICPNETIILGNENGSNPDYSFIWFPSIFLNSNKIGNPICKPALPVTYFVKITNTITKCFCFDTIEVKFLPTIAPEIVASEKYLCKSPVTLRVVQDFSEYNWIGMLKGKEITVTEPGLYYVYVLNDNGCESVNSILIEKKEIILDYPKLIDFGNICKYNSKASKTILVKNMTEDTMTVTSVKLDSNNKYFNFKVLNDSSYIYPDDVFRIELTLRDNLKGELEDNLELFISEPCVETINIKIKANIVPIEISMDKTIQKCPGVNLNIGNDKDVNNLKFQWQPDFNLDDANSPNPICSSDTSLKYFVTITNQIGCTEIDTVMVNVSIAQLEITTSSYEICKETVTLTATPGFETYLWSNGETENIITVNDPGIYSLTATDKYGCSLQNSIKINSYKSGIITPELIDLGYICSSGESSAREFSFYNKSDTTLTVESVIFEAGNEFFEVEILNENNNIQPDSALFIKIMTLENTSGITLGRIKIKISEPCIELIRIDVKAINSYFIVDYTDSLSVCAGESLFIGNKGDESSYSYNWSPVHFLNNSKIPNPICKPDSNITYFVNVINNESGCIAYDTVHIIVMSSKIEIKTSSEYFCKDEIELTATEGFISYLWSDGSTNGIIKIKESGMYGVTGIDRNGCKAETLINIKPYELRIDLPDVIDLGEVCLFEEKAIDAYLENLLNEFTIDTIYIQNDYGFELEENVNNNETLITGDKYNFKMKSGFKKAGKFTDKLIIRISQPCPATFEIGLKADILDNNLYISIPDTLVTVGTDICLPVYAYTDCPDSELPLQYQAEVSVNRFYFKPVNVLNGTLNSIIEKDDVFLVNFEDDDTNSFIGNESRIINHICGKVLLGKNKETAVNFESFKHNSDINIIKKNGSMKTEICEFDIRGIKYFNPTKMIVSNDKTYNNIIIKTFSQEKGSFDLNIYNSTGELLSKVNWFNNDEILNEKTHIFETVNFGTGIYFIVLQSPWNVLSDKIIIIK
ncbi:MAG: hypothetical protein RO257_15610 [Candidatus Kapabacteria bacterium]|nr:hypothetical protein [Candidatus Kapabacteria bacterium]